MSSGKTRVLLTVAGLHYGGAEIVIKHLVGALDRRHFDVSICCIKDLGAIGEALVRDGVDVVTLSRHQQSGSITLHF